MERYSVDLFVEDKYFGTIFRGPRMSDATAFRPDSILHYCFRCGTVFARFIVQDQSGTPSRFLAMAGCCRKCDSDFLYRVPGSIWLGYDPYFMDLLPPELLRQELLLHLNHWETCYVKLGID